MPRAVLAQGSLAPPPQIPYGLAITTEGAKLVAAAAIAEARNNRWTIAIAIVDPGGHLVYFEKMQDTQTGSVDPAIDKARIYFAVRQSSFRALLQAVVRVFECCA